MSRTSNSVARETDVRTELLDAATQLFASRGFDGTSLQDIVAQVGVRKASLLYHFSSKEHLRDAVVGRLLSHWNEVLPSLLGSAVGGKRRFDTVVAEALSFFTADANRARLLLREMLDRPEAMQQHFAAHVGPWLALIADYIRRGQSEGSIHPDLDPEAYVFHVIHLVLAGVALTEVSTSLLTSRSGRASPRARHDAELVRLAKAGMFIPKKKKV